MHQVTFLTWDFLRLMRVRGTRIRYNQRPELQANVLEMAGNRAKPTEAAPGPSERPVTVVRIDWFSPGQKSISFLHATTAEVLMSCAPWWPRKSCSRLIAQRVLRAISKVLQSFRGSQIRSPYRQVDTWLGSSDISLPR